MMLADYFARSALAAAQVLEGFDADRFRAHLEAAIVGVSAAPLQGECAATADLAVRLLARLYPRLAVKASDTTDRDQLAALALEINPNIEIADENEADTGLVIGPTAEPFGRSIFCGSDGWVALVDTASPQPSGASPNPVGAGAAACLGAAALFRSAFLPGNAVALKAGLRLNTWTGTPAAGDDDPNPSLPVEMGGDAVLVGAGAIGNGAVWVLARAPVSGTVHVIDHEAIELSNLQRYVLARRADEGAIKVAVATRSSVALDLQAHACDLATFLSRHGYDWPLMLLALDSAADRLAAQASLPGWVVNAWTQPGDLGVSTHSTFGGEGACVSCLYLPSGPSPNEDELVAQTLAVPHLQMDVRTLLHTGGPVQRPLLEAIAEGIGRPVDVLAAYEGRPIRDLYVEGFCGGAVIPLGASGQLRAEAQDVHVPLAPQSALAGVLLAGAALRHAAAGPPPVTTITRIDVLRPVGELPTQPARAARDGRCLCDDGDFRAVHTAKYGAGHSAGPRATHA